MGVVGEEVVCQHVHVHGGLSAGHTIFKGNM